MSELKLKEQVTEPVASTGQWHLHLLQVNIKAQSYKNSMT